MKEGTVLTQEWYMCCFMCGSTECILKSWLFSTPATVWIRTAARPEATAQARCLIIPLVSSLHEMCFHASLFLLITLGLLFRLAVFNCSHLFGKNVRLNSSSIFFHVHFFPSFTPVVEKKDKYNFRSCTAMLENQSSLHFWLNSPTSFAPGCLQLCYTLDLKPLESS